MLCPILHVSKMKPRFIGHGIELTETKSRCSQGETMTEEITKRDLTFFIHMLKIGQQGIFRDLETQHHMIIMMLGEPGISAVTVCQCCRGRSLTTVGVLWLFCCFYLRQFHESLVGLELTEQTRLSLDSQRPEYQGLVLATVKYFYCDYNNVSCMVVSFQIIYILR